MHVALGGCFRAPPVNYGITQDTGGHIAYVLGAAIAQAASDMATRVTIVTRAFDDAALGHQHGAARESVRERVVIRRLRTGNSAYLSKTDLMNELPALQSAFLALVRSDPPDVIHAHFADAAVLAITVRERTGVPVLYTPHSLGLDKGRCDGVTRDSAAHRKRLARERRAIERCDRIIVSSENERRSQIGAYDAAAIRRTIVARPGIELLPTAGTGEARALVAPWLIDPERPFLLAIARPVRKKNLSALLLAYACDERLRATCNVVILAGQHERIRVERDEQSGELDRLHAIVAQQGLAGRVALPPSHSPQSVAQLYRLAKEQRGVFVNPALHEPFGLTLIESARAGVPVVATHHGGPCEILATIGHGRLVDPRSQDAIADACCALLQDRGAYDRASRAGVNRGRQYCWAAWASTVERAIAGVQGDAMPMNRSSAVRDAGVMRCSPVSRISGRSVSGGTPRHFLACDIDGTLTGCASGVDRFRAWLDERAPAGPIFAVATGRELPQARAVISQWQLPQPSVWITSVGTEIWRSGPNGRLARCKSWASHLSRYWDRDAVLSALGKRVSHLQAANTQRPWKISLFGTAEQASAIEKLPALRGRCVRVVASHGRFIDLVPARAGKAAAIAFEASRHGIPLGRCIAAGDSGNDADMLALCGNAILVGNVLPEVEGIADRAGLYRASACHANGVIEGLRAFGFVQPASRCAEPIVEVA